VVWLILGVVIGGLVLGMLGVIPFWVALIAILAVTFFAAWWLDRTRPGRTAPFRDANRPDLYAPMMNRTGQVPTAYIDHPTGGGPPPGVERHGESSRRWPPRSGPSDDYPFGRR
jgi:hypothetical protein